MDDASDKSVRVSKGRSAAFWRPFRPGAVLWCLVVLLGWITGPAPAQTSSSSAGAAANSPLSSGEVKIDIESFGLGNVARFGDWCGVRLKILDTGTKSRDLLIRLAGMDYDGDTPLYQQEIASNPGTPQPVWMYMRLPFFFIGSGPPLSASAYEAVETAGSAAEGTAAYRAGRLLGYTEVRAPTGPSGSFREPTQGLIGVVGPRPLGLQAYQATSGGASIRGFNPYAHEIADILTGLTPASLPDRWMGLMACEAIVWAQGDPADLRNKPQARALREYVEHGGHLIIIMPSIGQTWTNAASNDLHDIMPLVVVSRQEVTDFQRYRPLLSREPLPGAKNIVEFPSRSIIHTFKPLPDAGPADAMRILNSPDGECVVARRLVGAGAVTLIGIDLNQTALSQGDLIDVDLFWHRILGRRGNYSDKAAQQANSSVMRRAWMVDQDIPREIARQGRAAAGVLVGFVVFVIYWLVAAPLGFFVLKRLNLSQHAWVAFVVAAAIFTAISWTGAKLLRPLSVEGSHFTILDHVYGQPTQRAKMWASVVVPWYGTARMSIGDRASAGDDGLVNPIASWDAPNADAGSWGGFPDVRGYLISSRSPDSMQVPTRSTVKQVEATWAGGPVWEMPRPARPEEGGTGKIDVIDSSGLPPAQRRSLLNGTLVHKLPAPIRDGMVLVVRRQQSLTRGGFGGLAVCQGDAFFIDHAWQPGEFLDLSIVTRPIVSTVPGQQANPTNITTVLESKFRPNVQLGVTADGMDVAQRLNALALFTQLPMSEGTGDQFAAQRSATHTWDLGMWFTQPCIIILGEVVGTDAATVTTPVPLMVDGEAVPMNGRIALRWIYPLPDNPPPYPATDPSLTNDATAFPTLPGDPASPPR